MPSGLLDMHHAASNGTAAVAGDLPDLDDVVADGAVVDPTAGRPGQKHGAGGEVGDERPAGPRWHICPTSGTSSSLGHAPSQSHITAPNIATV